jgi:histidine phosphotransfer protein HptB
MPSPTISPTGPIFSALATDSDLSELVEMYVGEMPDRIAAIQTLLAQAEWEELRRMAHQMKGAAGSYGFEAITPVAGAVEDSIRGGAPEEQIRQATRELLAMCSRVRAGTPE